MTDSIAVKRQLRSLMRAARLALRPGEAALRSSAACSAVTASAEFERAKVIATYRAMPGEVITDEIFSEARPKGKILLYPRVESRGGRMTFRMMDNLKDMVPGVWGILEPPQSAQVRQISDVDLVIVPGVAFDLKGGRLGQGGGFYDRIFEQLPKTAVKMGIAYDLQIVDSVPREEHDVMMDCLATESGLMIFRRSGGEPC